MDREYFFTWTQDLIVDKKHEPPTHGIVHEGFSGFRVFLARNKSRCKLIGYRPLIPHDTIPSNVGGHCNKTL